MSWVQQCPYWFLLCISQTGKIFLKIKGIVNKTKRGGNSETIKLKTKMTEKRKR